MEETRCKKEALYVWTGKEMIEMVGGVEFMTHVDRTRIRNGVNIRTIGLSKLNIWSFTPPLAPSIGVALIVAACRAFRNLEKAAFWQTD